MALDYPAGDFEVIVMDGCSKDKTVEIAQKLPVKVLSMPLNCPAAYNYAQKIAANPDFRFHRLRCQSRAAMVNKLVPHLEEPQVAGVSGSIDTWNSDNPWAKSIGYELKTRYSRIGKYTGRIATMNLLLKKAVIEEAGGWDENLPSQYDTDLGFRVSAKGYRIAYEPAAVCYHYNRPTLYAYYRQQLQYGKNTLKLYFKHGGLAKGDEITDLGMNIQPVLVFAAIVSFLLGIIPILRPLWYLSAVILATMILYFSYSASKVAAKFHDNVVLRLVVLYFVRSWAWFVGAVSTSLNYLIGKGRKK